MDGGDRPSPSLPRPDGADDEDAFLLITRRPSLASVRSDDGTVHGSSSRRHDASVRVDLSGWKLIRNWPLAIIATLDLTSGILNIATHQIPSTSPTILAVTEGLLRLRTLSITRPLSLLLLSLHAQWRRGSVWVVVASVVTLLVVLWEVNEGVQWRRVDRGRRGRGTAWHAGIFLSLDRLAGEDTNGHIGFIGESRTAWWDWTWVHNVARDEMLMGLILHTAFSVLEYLAFFLPLHLSPFPPASDPPSEDSTTIISNLNHRGVERRTLDSAAFRARTARGKLADATRRQHATRLRWDEEDVFADVSGAGQGSGVVHGEDIDRASAGLNSWAEEPDDGPSGPSTKMHGARDGGDESDEDSSGPSIGRYSDEGEGEGDAQHEIESDSDGSISSNEIIDLPPPRSTSYRLLDQTGSPSVINRRLNRSASGFASVLEIGRVGDVEAGMNAGQDDVEGTEEETLLQLGSTPPRDESRLERGLRRRWIRRAKDAFARRRTRTGTIVDVVPDGRYGTFGRERTSTA